MVQPRVLTAGVGGHREARGKGWDGPCSNGLEAGISVRNHVYLNVDTDDYTQKYLEMCVCTQVSVHTHCLAHLAERASKTGRILW